MKDATNKKKINRAEEENNEKNTIQNKTEKKKHEHRNEQTKTHKDTCPVKETGMEINERAQTSARLNDTVDVIEIYLNKRKNYFNLKPLLLLDYYYINI